MERITATIRTRMSNRDAHYDEKTIDLSKIIELFGDAGTECLIRHDGDEGLLRKYEDINIFYPTYVGDYIRVTAEIIKVGNTSRVMYFEAYKEITPRYDIHDSASEVLEKPILVCTATCIAVVKKHE